MTCFTWFSHDFWVGKRYVFRKMHVFLTTRNHINNREVAPINMCLKAAPKIVIGGWQKAELYTICAEAGLHAPYSLIKKCAISGAARLLDRPQRHLLHSLLPCNRPKAYNLKTGTRNYARSWATNQWHTTYLQINGILDNMLPLIEDTTQPTRLAKLAICVYIQLYTLEDFDKRPNPPYTYPPRTPTNTGAKGLLPRRI